MHIAIHQEKKWTHYLWEFIMLFLAVFCGFLAEYQLEHKIERDRVKKYMHDMVVNISNDRVRTEGAILENIKVGKGLDSLRAEIKLAMKGQVNVPRLYELRLRYSDVNYIAFNLSAITQLNSSGNLRLVTDDSLVIFILQYYDRKIKAVSESYEDILKNKYRLNELYEEVFDAAAMESTLSTEVDYTEAEGSALIESHPPTDTALALLTTDPKVLQALYNRLASYEWSIKQYNGYLRWANDHAKDLIKMTKEVYRFR